MSDILSKVKTLFAEFLSIDEASIQPESTIKDDLGVDSVDIVSVVSEIENTFSLKISIQKLLGLRL